MTRRALLGILSAAVSERLGPAARAAQRPARRTVLITLGGIRRQESWSQPGLRYIPHLYNDLLPQSLFYPYTANEGVTSHFNTISSILTGVWQRLDDWGSEKPVGPTLFHRFQTQTHAGPDQTWVVTSNKQLTANISPGINVILSKQLMVEAVERIITGQSARSRLEREQLLQEMTAVLETDYERIGWGVASESSFRDSAVKQTLLAALTSFILSGRAGQWRRTHLPDRARSAPAHRVGHADDQFLRHGGGPFRKLLAALGRDYARRRDLSPDVAVHPGHPRSGRQHHADHHERVRPRPGRLLDQRILQPPHQHRVLPHGLDHGAGTGRRQTRGRRARDTAARRDSIDRFLDGIRAGQWARRQAPGIPGLKNHACRRNWRGVCRPPSARRATISFDSGISSFPPSSANCARNWIGSPAWPRPSSTVFSRRSRNSRGEWRSAPMMRPPGWACAMWASWRVHHFIRSGGLQWRRSSAGLTPRRRSPSRCGTRRAC